MGGLGAVTTTVRRVTRLRGSGLRELALVSVLYVGYAAGRTLSDDALAPAQEVGRTLRAAEALVHLDVEAAASTWLAGVPVLAVLACWLYALPHYVVTPAVLLWLFHRHRDAYASARTVLAVVCGLGLLGYVLLPTAPPRLLPGYVDVLAAYEQWGWWGEAASAPEELAQWSNQLAALPSLHVAWAVWCAWAVHRHAAATGVRALALAYLVVTCVVVVVTANHWLLDVVAGVAVTALPVAVVEWRARSRPAAADQAALEPAG